MGRPLTAAETALARSVFGDAIRLERVRLEPGGFGGFAVTLGSRLLLPARLNRSDFAAAGLGAQALLVHELTHVWQFQTRPLSTLASWALTVLRGGYGPGLPGYRYSLPVADFARLNLEQQASVVEHAFILARGGRTAGGADAGWAHHLKAATPFPITPG